MISRLVVLQRSFPCKKCTGQISKNYCSWQVAALCLLPPLDRSLFLWFAALQYGRSRARDLAASRDLPGTKMARLWLCVSLSLCSFVTHSYLAPFRLTEKLLLQAVRVQTYILRICRVHRLGGYVSAASMTHIKSAGAGGRAGWQELPHVRTISRVQALLCMVLSFTSTSPRQGN